MLSVIPIQVKAAIAAGALLGASYAGWTVRSWKCESALTDVLRAQETQRAAMQAKTETAATEYEGQRHAIQTETRTREVELRTIYRDNPANCALDPAAVSLLEQAANRVNSQNPREPESALPADPVADPGAKP